MPLTGPYGTEAQDQVRCAQLAVAEFNEAGGLNGQKAELLVRDDKLDPGEAATRTLELIERDKVDLLRDWQFYRPRCVRRQQRDRAAHSPLLRVLAGTTRSQRCRIGAATRSMRG